MVLAEPGGSPDSPQLRSVRNDAIEKMMSSRCMTSLAQMTAGKCRDGIPGIACSSMYCEICLIAGRLMGKLTYLHELVQRREATSRDSHFSERDQQTIQFGSC